MTLGIIAKITVKEIFVAMLRRLENRIDRDMMSESRNIAISAMSCQQNIRSINSDLPHKEPLISVSSFELEFY